MRESLAPASGRRSARASAAPHARSPSWREFAALLALTALALALRTTSLSRSLFTDEAYSLALAQRSLEQMVKLFGYEANGTLYSIVLWPLIRLFGDSEQLLRAPAVLAGAASVPAMWWAARQLSLPRTGAMRGRCGGRRAAWIAAVLLAVNPMAVWYSQEARAYSFVVLAACLAFGALARAVAQRAANASDVGGHGDVGEHGDAGEQGDAGGHGDAGGLAHARAAWVGYVAAMVAMAYCDLLAVPLALPAQALLARRAGREAWRGWLRSLLALLVCCVPLLLAAGISRSRRNALYWLPKTDRALVELALQEFAGGFAKVSAVGWLSLLAGGALAVYAFACTRGAAWARERSALTVATTWGLLPVVLLLAISRAQPVFWPRYAILSLPGLCLLVGLAAERTLQHDLRRAHLAAADDRGAGRSVGNPRVVAAAACVAALAALAVFADARQRHEIQENWRPAAAWLLQARAPGQPTIVDNALVLPSLGYYDPAFSAANGDLIVQEWRDEPLPAGFVGFKDRTGYGSVPNGPPSVAAFATLARRGGGTVWLIVSEVDDELQADPKHGAAVAWARSHCRVQMRESIGVWVMRASACS